MSIFISVPKTIECVLTAVIFSALFSVCCYKLLGILQAYGYSGKKFFQWSRKKNNAIWGRHAMLALLCVLACAVISLCFSFAGEWSAVCGLAAYVIFFAVYIWSDNKIALKSPAVFTSRFKRLYILLFFINAVFIYLAVTLLNFAAYIWGNAVFETLRYCPLAVFALLFIPLVMLTNLISKAYETPHNRKFVRKAGKKLAASSVKKIGITGSYGKTSAKLILTSLLSSKYRVLATPHSYNTPMGIALTINSAELENFDIFIAEMGARHAGDISELCELCSPDYGVITGICPQHLETFGSLENIVKAKGELLEYSKECAVISPDCADMFSGYTVKKIAERCASDVVCSCGGTELTLSLGGESRRVKTKLLGKHSAENIALAAQVAFAVGMSLDEIAEAVGGIDYIEHRLQLIQSGGVNILDDGYNSNIKGAAAAIEVLNTFGGRKIAVTPGLVELGVLEEKENENLGEKLVGLDLVILVGETLVLPVKKGYEKAGGDMEKLVIKPTLAAAQEELKKFIQVGDAVLFLNDLPDIYN